MEAEAAHVLVPCGGGGLTSGIALALAADAPEMVVRPCEPLGFDDVLRSLASGGIERNNTQSGSICDAIVTPAPGDLTFPVMKDLCEPGLAVSDEDCLQAMKFAFLRLKIVVEPGAAVALAAVLFHGTDLPEGDVVVVVSGGNVDPEMFARALEM